MSLTIDQPGALTSAEAANLVAWGDDQGLEVVIMPSVAGTTPRAFVGYGDGIPSWIIYRTDGRLWLGDIDPQAGRTRERSKRPVTRIEHATNCIQADMNLLRLSEGLFSQLMAILSNLARPMKLRPRFERLAWLT